ncbi:MAG: hypothetical protein ACT4PI_12940 [Actinomycetota bacterium]
MTTMRISVRLDVAAFLALRRLEASGLSRSAAVRQALIASAAQLRTTDSPEASGGDVLELANFRAKKR